jgi:monofunctional biosynthetic peptidoglycan transglycosylase
MGGVTRRVAGWAAWIVGAMVLGAVALALLFRVVRPPVTSLMVIRTAEALAHGRPMLPQRSWVPLDAVSPALLRAVIAAEDARFFRHRGVDAAALRRARAYNRRHDGRRLHGGSTITMQCARSVFLWPGRTYVRKALEVGLAALLEVVWGKRRILEVYVNVVEWGDGVFGVEAASRRYFGVPAARLTAGQAALLVAVLPNPRRWSPAAPTAYIRRRAAAIEARAARVRLEASARRPSHGGGARPAGAAACRTAPHYTVGLTLWFRRNTFVGSSVFFSATSRS